MEGQTQLLPGEGGEEAVNFCPGLVTLFVYRSYISLLISLYDSNNDTQWLHIGIIL